MKSNEKNKDPYYIAYKMMTESLRKTNVYFGLQESLDIAKEFLKSECVLLYKKGKDEKYHLFKTSSYYEDDDKYLDQYINYALSKKSQSERLELKLDKESKTLNLIPLLNDNSFLLATVNNDRIENEKLEFLEILEETMSIIIKRMEIYYDTKKRGESDGLTGLKNRLSYQEKKKILDQDKDLPVTIAILDLFRLKYINDNVNHYAGDYYIKKTAEILNNYFPEYADGLDKNDNVIKIRTGDSIYRIGGDEFIIISEKKTEALLEVILEYVAVEIENINLSTTEIIHKGVNYGIVQRENHEDVDTLYKKADEKLSEEKKIAYKKLGIDRRQ